ncbi:winged helix-turn-helix domain-containing protein [Panacibacter microcysteis]|nr:winged helix-turn-helix domain-containing protein [Panacibacter microcysteis]
MPGKRYFPAIQGTYFGGLLLLMLISVICVAFSMTDSNDFDVARREVLLRRVGHEILLQSGDSTSRVLPVEKTGSNEYQLRFENAFTFQPEALVSTTQRLLAKDPLAVDYIVNVINCADTTVAYAYAVSANKKDDIVACIGRKQPTACYMINIQFKPAGVMTAKSGLLAGSIAVAAFAGFVFFRLHKPRKVLTGSPGVAEMSPTPALPDNPHTELFTLGAMLFDAGARKLTVNEQSVDLTKTEARVLRIFALSPNEIIERSRLQKEIWEDDGVIVGRSLDMFISKLRKKLEADPAVRIVVIRGKGYKLEIS